VTARNDNSRQVAPEPLAVALTRAADAPLAVLGLGIPRCPATQLLPASLSAVAARRPTVAFALGILSTPDDWAARETELWPRGIRISRSVVPVLFVLRDGRAIATRHGGASASVIDGWFAATAGLAPSDLGDGWVREEARELERIGARRAQHAAVKGRHYAD
jgi:hypothetical protein